jgi:hypothetical protein
MDGEASGEGSAGRRGDPNRYKQIGAGLLMADLRKAVGPTLRAAGFVAVGRSAPDARAPVFVEWGRADELFSIAYERGRDWVRLVAVHVLAGGDDLRTVAETPFDGTLSQAEILARIASFNAEVAGYAQGLGADAPGA